MRYTKVYHAKINTLRYTKKGAGIKMADEVFSVKMDTDLKQELEQLAEDSKQNKKDFMASLISTYKARLLEAQNIEPQIPELASLQQHVRRIEEIYISLAASRRDIITEAGKQQVDLITEITTLKTELLDTKKAAELAQAESQQQINSILSETQQKQEEAEQKVTELIHRAATAEEAVSLTKDLLAAERKMRATAEAEAFAMTERLAAAEKAAAEAATVVNEVQAVADQLKTDLALATERANQCEKTVAELQSKHAAEIASLRERVELEKDKAVLAAEKASFERIKELQTALNEAQKRG